MVTHLGQRRRASLAAALLLAAAATLAAQGRSGAIALPDHPGRWNPLTLYLRGGRTFGPTAAESRVMKSQLDSLVAVVRRTPALATPLGFETVGSETVEADRLSEDVPGWQPVRGSLLVIPLLWYRSCDSCAAQRNGEGVGAQVAVNELGLMMPGSGTGGCGGPEVFTAPREVARIGGYPLYSTGAVLIAARDVPPFLPVTRDEWITAQINQGKNATGCRRPDYRAAWWDSIRGTWTPGERAMEAWEVAPGPRPPGPFQILGTPGARGSHAYVRINPALFDSTAPRTAMQTIVLTVAFPRRDPRPLPRGARPPLPCSNPIPRSPSHEIDQLAIHEAIWCNLDWAALRGLLR